MFHRRRADARKQPHQERARVTLDAILVAAIRILETEGADRLTTTRIADVAGVSVGSLYQYFPNREAIVGAIIDRQLDAMFVAFRGLVGTLDELSIEQAVAGVLFGLLEASRIHGKLHAPLYEEMPAARRSERHARTLSAYVEIVAATLATRSDVAVADPAIAATLIVHASHGVIRALVVDPTSGPSMIQEAVRMITRYVTDPANAKRVAATAP